MKRWINGWVIVGAVFTFIIICMFSVVLIWALSPKPASSSQSQINFLVISAPTLTPTLSGFLTPTPTPAVSSEGISIGTYVQITGTEGEGLRLRSGPGVGFALRFVGMDNEVFKVIDGPKTADEFTWWLLQAPYDETRSGWAASKYLTIVPPSN